MTSKSFYSKLVKQIRAEPIDIAWNLYILAQPLVKWDKWQRRRTREVLHGQGKRLCWNWCRGSGKTEKSTLLAVFFLLRGKDVYWFAASRKQLERAQVCWAKNPFVKHAYPRGFIVTSNRTSLNTLGAGILGMSCLTSMENASGPHPDICFWDEVALLKKEIFVKSLKVLNHDPDAVGLFFSTPIRESVFHDITRLWGESIQTYLTCSWMNHAQIALERLPGLEWMWEQENMCVYSAAEGAVFPEKSYIIEDSNTWPTFNHNQYLQGVDFGGGKPHTALRIAVNDKDIYLVKEDAFKYKYDDELLQLYCNKYPTEIESGGANETMAPNMVNVIKEPFTNESKYIMIGNLLQHRLHIDKALTPKTLTDMLQAVWEQTATGKPKVETGVLDYLAALMHAANHIGEGTIDFARTDTPELTNPYEQWHIDRQGF